MSNFWTVRFLKTECESIFGFPHTHIGEVSHCLPRFHFAISRLHDSCWLTWGRVSGHKTLIVLIPMLSWHCELVTVVLFPIYRLKLRQYHSNATHLNVKFLHYKMYNYNRDNNQPVTAAMKSMMCNWCRRHSWRMKLEINAQFTFDNDSRKS